MALGIQDEAVLTVKDGGRLLIHLDVDEKDADNRFHTTAREPMRSGTVEDDAAVRDQKL
jgi:hypothetical protein